MKLITLPACIFLSLAVFSLQCDTNSNNSEIPSSVSKNFNSSDAQNATSNSSVVIDKSNYVSRATTGARVEGESHEIKIDILNLQTVLNQPTPKVWFVFDCKQYNDVVKSKCTNDVMKSNLPSEAEPLIDEFWKRNLTMLYNSYPSKNFETKESASAEHYELTKKMEAKFVELSIDTPEGKRPLTYQESDLIFGFLVEKMKPIRDRIEKLKAEQHGK